MADFALRARPKLYHWSLRVVSWLAFSPRFLALIPCPVCICPKPAAPYTKPWTLFVVPPPPLWAHLFCLYRLQFGQLLPFMLMNDTNSWRAWITCPLLFPASFIDPWTQAHSPEKPLFNSHLALCVVTGICLLLSFVSLLILLCVVLRISCFSGFIYFRAVVLKQPLAKSGRL